MKNYEELKEAIQQANPEIMEFKFGCEVQYRGQRASFLEVEPDPFSAKGRNFLVFSPSIEGNNTAYTDDSDLIILGRSIRLADVLLAIASELPRSDSYFVDADGGFHEWFSPKGRLDLRTVARWDLTKDLDHQSKECKEFLIDLLVNE